MRISPYGKLTPAGKVSPSGYIGYKGRGSRYETSGQRRARLIKQQQDTRTKQIQQQRLQQRAEQQRLQQLQEIQQAKQLKQEKATKDLNQLLQRYQVENVGMVSSGMVKNIKHSAQKAGLSPSETREIIVKFEEGQKQQRYALRTRQRQETFGAVVGVTAYDKLGQPMSSKAPVKFKYDTSKAEFRGERLDIPQQKSMIAPTGETSPKGTGGIIFKKGEAGVTKDYGYLPSEDVVGQTKGEKFLDLFPKQDFGEKTPTAKWFGKKGEQIQSFLGRAGEKTSDFLINTIPSEEKVEKKGFGLTGSEFSKSIIQSPFALLSFGTGVLTDAPKTKKGFIKGVIDLPSEFVKDPYGTSGRVGGDILGQSLFFKAGGRMKAKAPTKTEILGAEQIITPKKIQTDVIFKTTEQKSWGRTKTEYGQARGITDVSTKGQLQLGTSNIIGVIGKKKGTTVVPKKQFQAYEKTIGKEKSYNFLGREYEGFQQVTAGRVAVSKGRKFKSSKRGFEAKDLFQEKYISWGKGLNLKEGSVIVGKSIGKSGKKIQRQPSTYRGFIRNLKSKRGDVNVIMSGGKSQTPFQTTFQRQQLGSITGAIGEASKLIAKSETKIRFIPQSKPTPKKPFQPSQIQEVQTRTKQQFVQPQKEITRTRTKQFLNLGLSQKETLKMKQKLNLQSKQQSKQTQQMKMKQQQLQTQKQLQKLGQRQQLKSKRIAPRPMFKFPKAPRYSLTIPTSEQKRLPPRRKKKEVWDIFLKRGGKWRKVKRVRGSGRRALYWGEFLTEEHLGRSFRVRKVGQQQFAKLRFIGEKFRRPTRKKGKQQDLFTAIEKTKYALDMPFEKYGLQRKRNKNNMFLF